MSDNEIKTKWVIDNLFPCIVEADEIKEVDFPDQTTFQDNMEANLHYGPGSVKKRELIWKENIFNSKIEAYQAYAEKLKVELVYITNKIKNMINGGKDER